MDKSEAPNINMGYLQVPGSIPVETPRNQIHMDVSQLIDDCFYYFNSNLVLLLEGLCRSYPCRFEFSISFEFLLESKRQPLD